MISSLKSLPSLKSPLRRSWQVFLSDSRRISHMAASSSENEKPAAVKLPPGYKFFPSDEILMDYLKQRNIGGRKLPFDIIPTIDLYDLNPNQIPYDKFEDGVEGEWIFFSTRPNTDLVTKDGYWHLTSLPTEVKLDGRIMGFKQTFTFHWGIAPEGEKSNFLIHEYELNTEVQNFVACRVRDIEVFTRGQRDDWINDTEDEGDSGDEDWEH